MKRDAACPELGLPRFQGQERAGRVKETSPLRQPYYYYLGCEAGLVKTNLPGLGEKSGKAMTPKGLLVSRFFM